MGTSEKRILAEIAEPGLHDSVFRFFEREYSRDVSILDCGAGTGAWIERLRKGGYQKIKAVEKNKKDFQSTFPFFELDLNSEFSELIREKFDVITAIEIIEHLENPSNFLRQCEYLLKPGGSLVITTPNIEAAPSRLKFLVVGQLRHFDDWGDKTHITPISVYMLRRIASKNGFVITHDLPLIPKWGYTRPVIRVFSYLLAPLLRGAVYGECRLFQLRRAQQS